MQTQRNPLRWQQLRWAVKRKWLSLSQEGAENYSRTSLTQFKQKKEEILHHTFHIQCQWRFRTKIIDEKVRNDSLSPFSRRSRPVGSNSSSSPPQRFSSKNLSLFEQEFVQHSFLYILYTSKKLSTSHDPLLAVHSKKLLQKHTHTKIAQGARRTLENINHFTKRKATN